MKAHAQDRSYSRLLIGLQHTVSVHLRTTNDLADKVRRLAIHDEPLQRTNTLTDHGHVIFHLRRSVGVPHVSHRAHILLEILNQLRETGRRHVGLLGLGRSNDEAPLVTERLGGSLRLFVCQRNALLPCVLRSHAPVPQPRGLCLCSPLRTS